MPWSPAHCTAFRSCGPRRPARLSSRRYCDRKARARLLCLRLKARRGSHDPRRPEGFSLQEQRRASRERGRLPCPSPATAAGREWTAAGSGVATKRPFHPATRETHIRWGSMARISHNLEQAGKLTRAFAVLLDALNHHRGKGQQKITVEHVHVHSGGQAVVGVVEAPGGGVQPNLLG